MNKLKLLFLGMAVSGAFGANAQKTLFDFEGSTPTLLGSGWGNDAVLADNPYACGNESSNCCSLSGSGMQGFWNENDLSKYIIAVDVFSASDATLRGYSQAHDFNIDNAVPAKRWKTVYFDWRDKATGGEGKMLYFGTQGATILVDNIRAVTSIPAEDAYASCEGFVRQPDLKYTFGRVQIGGAGFVSGLISVPGKVKLARTDVGGAYKWDASNCEWKQMFDFVSEANIGLLSVEAMAVDPNNTNNMYFLCGCQYYSDQKTSVLYTNDGGKTFKESVVSTVPLYVHGNGNGRNAGERIAVDPNNSKVIIAGGRVGTPVIISTDGAATWKELSGFPKVYTNQVKWPAWVNNLQGTTENENGVVAIVFDETKKLANGNTGRIFAGVSRSGADNVYVTEDGGSTWKAITIDNSLMPVRMKMNGKGDLIVTMADKCWGASSGAIYKYNVETGKVTNISPSKLACSDVAIKASNPDYMITSTNNTWVNQAWDNGKTANGDIIYVTKDGGKSWTSLQDKMVLTNNGVTWVPGYALHWCGGICLDAEDENKASFTSGNGIWSCNNIWEILENPNAKPEVYFDVQGVEESVPLDMISIQGKDPMSVIGDYTGFVHKSVAEYAPIHNPAPGTTYGIGYAGSNTDVIARVCASEYEAQNSYITTDGGKKWNSMGNIAAYHVGLSADGKKVFICTKAGELKVSSDNGASWSATGIKSGASYVTGDPVNSDYIYATTKIQKDGWIDITTFYVSADGGKTFTSSLEMEFNKFSRITTVPGHEGVVYISDPAKGVMMSKDYGKTFSKVGLEKCEAIGVGKGKTSSSYTLFAYGNDGQGEGIFRSDDEGKTWLMTNDSRHLFGGPGNGGFVVGDMNVFGRFYMSTTGMGIVYGDESSNYEAPTYSCYTKGSVAGIDEVAAEVESDELVINPNPAAEGFSLNESGDLVITNMLGSVVAAGNYVAGTEVGAELANGVYVVSINGKTQKLIKK